jgi:TRAP-type uncharacterized transport system substrate-binding protein
MQASTRRRSPALRIASGGGVLKGSWLFRLLAWLAAFVSLSTMGSDGGAQAPAAGQPLTASQQHAARAALNGDSLLIATGPDGSHPAMARDMAAAASKGTAVRLLPIAVGRGAETLRDLVFLRGVDMAIVPTNVLAHTKTIEALVGAGLPQRIAYITHLYGEEVHLLAGSSITALEGLRHKKVAVPLDDGNALYTAHDLFERLGIEVEIVRLRAGEALEKARSNELSAVLLVGGKPLQQLLKAPKDGRLRFLRLPLSRPLEPGYSPAALGADDYPTLIPPGFTVETVAVGAVLMANTGKGYEDATRRIAKFIPVFFANVADLTLVERHPKWRELNLATPLPGWNRLPAAEEWLRNAKEEQKAALQKEFDEFLRSTRQPGAPEITASQRKKLFEEFVDWTRQSVGATGGPARP